MLLLAGLSGGWAQAGTPVAPNDVPASVTAIVEAYLKALQAPDAAQTEARVLGLFAGRLLSSDGKSIAVQTRNFSLPRDRQHAAAYTLPVRIVSASVQEGYQEGFDAASISGKLFSLQLAKPEGGTAELFVVIPAGGNPRLVRMVGTL